MGNSKGNYYSSREHSMAAYDKLPPTARKALQGAVFDWATQPFLTRWNNGMKGYKTGADIAARVREADQRQMRKSRR